MLDSITGLLFAPHKPVNIAASKPLFPKGIVMEKQTSSSAVLDQLDGILAPYGSLDQLSLVAKVGEGKGGEPVVSGVGPDVRGELA